MHKLFWVMPCKWWESIALFPFEIGPNFCTISNLGFLLMWIFLNVGPTWHKLDWSYAERLVVVFSYFVEICRLQWWNIPFLLSVSLLPKYTNSYSLIICIWNACSYIPNQWISNSKQFPKKLADLSKLSVSASPYI